MRNLLIQIRYSNESLIWFDEKKIFSSLLRRNHFLLICFDVFNSKKYIFENNDQHETKYPLASIIQPMLVCRNQIFMEKIFTLCVNLVFVITIGSIYIVRLNQLNNTNAILSWSVITNQSTVVKYNSNSCCYGTYMWKKIAISKTNEITNFKRICIDAFTFLFPHIWNTHMFN